MKAPTRKQLKRIKRFNRLEAFINTLTYILAVIGLYALTVYLIGLI